METQLTFNYLDPQLTFAHLDPSWDVCIYSRPEKT